MVNPYLAQKSNKPVSVYLDWCFIMLTTNIKSDQSFSFGFTSLQLLGPVCVHNMLEQVILSRITDRELLAACLSGLAQIFGLRVNQQAEFLMLHQTFCFQRTSPHRTFQFSKLKLDIQHVKLRTMIYNQMIYNQHQLN